MDNTCIVGYGMVGKAMAEVFGIKKHFDVLKERSNMNIDDVRKCRLVFICLPTPVSEKGVYQTKEIKEFIYEVENEENNCLYVIRSTVFPGFAHELQEEFGFRKIISNPEFLSEVTAVQDVKNPPFIVIGGIIEQHRKEVRAFYESRIKSAPVIETDNTTAELSKLTLNAYFATKVIFANQVYDAAEKFKANYSTIKKILEGHPFGPKNHFEIFFRGIRGVHGHCLPKDSKAFGYYANSKLVQTVVELNKQYEV